MRAEKDWALASRAMNAGHLSFVIIAHLCIVEPVPITFASIVQTFTQTALHHYDASHGLSGSRRRAVFEIQQLY